ncbi:hypothetical protein ATO6_11500 [Oceanicola sp. 22II-s10i]|nr:hypothetical protein ATO6_11500 [Oceanicola sp. 22II-s10i]
MQLDQTTITQGEFAVVERKGATISTVLGSCVATCLWDPDRGVGGMNHMLTTRSGFDPVGCDAVGVNAMELLINALNRLGADRRRLRGKIFGGARMVSGLSDIGHTNGQFALEYLDREGIPCLGHSLGGTRARQVRFFPAEGRVLMRSVAPDRRIEAPLSMPIPSGNAVELF